MLTGHKIDMFLMNKIILMNRHNTKQCSIIINAQIINKFLISLYICDNFKFRKTLN